MSHAYLLVEGQTKEIFVNELLVPHYARMGFYLTSIIVSTSPGYHGGVVSFVKIKSQIEKLCKQDNGTHATTLFDLYALPDGLPGKSSAAYPAGISGQRRAESLETKPAKSIGQHNFIPNLLVHEFETLLFVQIETLEQQIDDDSVLEPLCAVRRTALPEDINDSPLTAPSKRILSAWQGHQKTFHGPLTAYDIGLDTMRAACPHFDGRLQKLEAPCAVAPLSQRSQRSPCH